MNPLDEHMKTNNEPKDPWTIKTDRDADWVARVIIHNQTVIADNKKLADEYHRQIDEWLAETTHDAEQSIVAMSEIMRSYLVVRLEYEKSKTLKLPSGAVSLRKAGPEYTVDGEKIKNDNPALLEYLRRSSPDYLKIKEYADWGELKKTLIPTETGRVINSDGEILGFMAAWTPPDNISVKGALK